MTKSMFKLGQTYKTRDGRSARIICIDTKGMENPLIALVSTPDGQHEAAFYYRTNGQFVFGGAHEMDLMPRTKTVTRYLNVYAEHCFDTGGHESEDAADAGAHSSRLACIPYQVTIPDDGSETT